MKYPYIVNKNGTWYPAGTEVPEDKPIEVDLVDDMPDGALDTNADGSVKAYDADTVKSLEEEAGEVLQEQTKTKGGKKK